MPQAYKRRPSLMGFYALLPLCLFLILCGPVQGLCIPTPPDDKTLEEYLREVAGKNSKFKKLDEAEQGEFIAQQVALAKREAEMERQKLSTDPLWSRQYVYLSRYKKFMKKPVYESAQAQFQKKGTSIESAGVRTFERNGEPVVDERQGVECVAATPIIEALEAADRETGGKLQMGSCWRSENRQMANKVIAVIKCAGTANPDDDELWKCIVKTRSGKSPIGFSQASAHSTPFGGFDIENWRQYNSILAKHGFVCGCASYGRGDMNHCVWAAPPKGAGDQMSCQMMDGMSRVLDKLNPFD